MPGKQSEVRVEDKSITTPLSLVGFGRKCRGDEVNVCMSVAALCLHPLLPPPFSSSVSLHSNKGPSGQPDRKWQKLSQPAISLYWNWGSGSAGMKGGERGQGSLMLPVKYTHYTLYMDVLMKCADIFPDMAMQENLTVLLSDL